MLVPSESRRVGVALVAGLLLSIGGACSKKSAPQTSAPSVEGSADSTAAGGELAQLEAYEAQLRSYGIEPSRARGQSKSDARGPESGAKQEDAAVGESADESEENETVEAFAEPPPADEPEASPSSTASADPGLVEEGDRCVNLCVLSEAICELEVRICEMSEDHGEDALYADACERAIDDCSVSGDACNTCSP